jgi:hypothetical protein
MMNRFRLLLAPLAGAAAAIGLAVLSPSAAVAETATAPLPLCSGTSCDNKDPVDSGCAASGVVVDSQTTAKGTFRLYYSTACETNWIQVGNYAGGGPHLYMDVCDLDRPECVAFNSGTNPGLHYGNMVYSPGSNCAKGYADYDSDTVYEVVLESSSC